MLDLDFVLKICDFGFSAKTVEEDNENTRKLFDSADPVGSPEYNAPEISNAEKYGGYYYGEEADFFAIGIVLFMMCI